MELRELIRPGITAVIGGGGKTTFLRTAGEQLSRGHHTVLLCTTTKIFPFPGLPLAGSLEQLDQLRVRFDLVTAGVLVPELGKLRAPDIPMEELARRFEYVLVEADGSAQRPMKAHADHEPVIPEGCGQVVCIVGASGFGRPIAEAAHRPERYAALAGAVPEDLITPELEAAVLTQEKLHDLVIVNQVEEAERAEFAQRCAERLDCPVYAGSLRGGEVFKCE